MKRWIRRIAIAIGCTVALLVMFGATMAYLGSHGYLQNWGMRQGQKQLVKEFPELGKPARPYEGATRTSAPRNGAELYSMTNIWSARMSFTEKGWKQIAPTRVEPAPMFANGRIVLRNPKASRSGLAGVIGIEYKWTAATKLEFGDAVFTNVAVRYRGNGTYINSLYGPKQSFKVDLNKFTKGQCVGGADELNFVNAIPDDTYLRDTLAERLFRELGVPAPRTGYAYLTRQVAGSPEEPLGLYVMVENIDGTFAKDRFGTKKAAIFKPVTYELFQYLGEDWSAYAPIYDLKTEATPAQQKRVIDLARLVSEADDRTFAAELPNYLDVEEFASFVAGHVLLSACDGFLANGQNFYLYLDPRTEKFGFIPWDQDHSFGEFGYAGTAEKREQMSVWEPYVYDFRFLKRVMKTEAFRAIYRKRLETALANEFTEERLFAEIDDLAARLRPAVEAENSFRLKRFDQAVSSTWLEGPRDGAPEGPRAPVHQIKRFIHNRIQSVRDQLAGRSQGVVLRRQNF